MTISAALKTDELELGLSPNTYWFAPRCCVVVRGEEREVLAGGVLIATVGPKDTALRNLILVGISEQPDVHLGILSRAFGMSSEAVRQLRRLYEAEGLSPLLERRRGGSEAKKRAVVERKALKLFAAGHTVDEVYAAIGKTVSRTTVMRIGRDWRRERPAAREAEPAAVAPKTDVPLVVAAPLAERAGGGDQVVTSTRSPRSAEWVQHLGCWLLIAMVGSLKLQARAFAIGGERVSTNALRLAFDAIIAALALGQQCVEGVRRLATSSAGALLLASFAPSPTFVRRTLGGFAAEGRGAALQLSMARGYLERTKLETEGEGPVFYVDNHLRPYTGKHVVRKGWRMQDKRVRPGATDYYLHDEDGRPLGRVTAPQHGSLTDFLSPISGLLRLALPDENILVAFDRAGAFPEQMASLRDAGVEFVTYERRPYALLAESEFTEKLLLGGEQLLWCEPRQKNLGGGRGRVRRICVRTADGRQLNLVASSTRAAERLIEVMHGRWVQENGFKHGAERWGFNQLDGRAVVPYAPDTIVPNPARRRLERALAIWRVREGQARSELARLSGDDTRRARWTDELAQAVAEQQRLVKLRASTPKRAPVQDTELAGKLVHHELEYKLLLDTVRVACANAESELAALLGPLLPRAAEAKKMLANLFAAPGRLQVAGDVITVTLSAAGTRRELQSVGAFFTRLDELRLSMPADQRQRRLRFRLAQLS